MKNTVGSRAESKKKAIVTSVSWARVAVADITVSEPKQIGAELVLVSQVAPSLKPVPLRSKFPTRCAHISLSRSLARSTGHIVPSCLSLPLGTASLVTTVLSS